MRGFPRLVLVELVDVLSNRVTGVGVVLATFEPGFDDHGERKVEVRRGVGVPNLGPSVEGRPSTPFVVSFQVGEIALRIPSAPSIASNAL